MKTLVIPCGGRSSRFPNMRPKWLLTHPRGNLMIFEGLKEFPVGSFDRVVITIHKSHLEMFNSDVVLKQASPFPLEICVLEEWTNGPAETIAKTILLMEISGTIVTKDSDNLTGIQLSHMDILNTNFVVGVDIVKNSVSKPESKSFLLVDENNLLDEIVEKKIASGIISAGVYGLTSAEKFLENYKSCQDLMPNSEVYMSHVISHMIKVSGIPFEYIEASSFEDWGTIDEWRKTQKRHATFFCDFDGVLVQNCGRFGVDNWESEFSPLDRNLRYFSKLSSEGAEFIVTTSRDASQAERIRIFLEGKQIHVRQVITNLPHSPRFLVNDFAPTNPYPSATAINLPRDGQIEDYFQ